MRADAAPQRGWNQALDERIVRAHQSVSTVAVYLTVFVVGGAAGTWAAWNGLPAGSGVAWGVFPYAGYVACCGAFSRVSLRAGIIVLVAGGALLWGLHLLDLLWPYLTLALVWPGFPAGIVTRHILRMASGPRAS